MTIVKTNPTNVSTTLTTHGTKTSFIALFSHRPILPCGEPRLTRVTFGSKSATTTTTGPAR